MMVLRGGVHGRLGLACALAAAVALALPAAAAAEINSPMPGGEYTGETSSGERVAIEVSSESDGDAIEATLRMPCAGVSERFQIDDPDGGFAVETRDRGIKLQIEGRFTDLERAEGTVRKARTEQGHCKRGSFEAMVEGHEAIERETVTIGPYDIHPSGGGHGGGGNIGQRIDKPCEDCFIVGMDPDLVNEDGSSANHDTNAMLHHTVLANLDDQDATCASWPERFFASGNERTDFVIPQGYGYRVQSGDRWGSLTHLMNMGHEMQRLAIDVEFYFVRAPAEIESVRPMWLDIDNCRDSEYMIPAGKSDTHWDFEVTPELEGGIVAIGGHVHNDGIRIELTNETRGESICNSVAGYGTISAYMGNIESMTGCVGEPVATIRAGDVLRLHSVYDSLGEQHDVMGIMLGYVAPGLGP
jgi:hypothetical protein